jgi:PST family polysaccharide transporter
MPEELLQSEKLLKSGIIKNTKWNILAKLLPKGINLLTTLVLARFLMPEDFGLFGMALVIIGFMEGFSDGGVGRAIVRDHKLSGDLLTTLFWFITIIGFILSFITYLFAPFVIYIYDEPELEKLIRWFAVAFLVKNFGNFFNWMLQRELLFKKIAIVSVLESVTWFSVSTSVYAE